MSTWRLVRARSLDLRRGWFWKPSADSPSLANISRAPVVLLTLYLALVYVGTLLLVARGEIAGRSVVITAAQMELVADVHAWLAAGMGLFLGIVAFVQFHLEEGRPLHLPVPRRAVTRSFLLVRLHEIGAGLVVLVFPGCVFLVRLTGRGPGALAADLVSLTLVAVCGMMAAVVVGCLLRRAGRGGSRTLVAAGILVLLTAVAFSSGLLGLSGNGWVLGDLVRTLAAAVSPSRLLLGPDGGALPFRGLVFWWGGLVLAAAVLLELAARLLKPTAEAAGEPVRTAATSRWRRLPLHLLPPALRPFVERDLIIYGRQPLLVVKQLGVVVVALIGLPLVFPEADIGIFLLTVLQIPALLAGMFILHSFGSEGDFIHVIRLAAGVDALYRSRLAVGVVAIPLISLAVYLVLAPLYLARVPLEVVALGGLVLVAEAVVLVYWAMAMGTFCADFSAKKLRPDYGVTISGELAYWGGAGLLSLAQFVLVLAYLDRRSVVVAVCVGLLVVMIVAIRRFLVIGRHRLLAA